MIVHNAGRLLSGRADAFTPEQLADMYGVGYWAGLLTMASTAVSNLCVRLGVRKSVVK